MDHRYRGQLLSNEERATALKSVESTCKQLSVAVAPLDEVLAFVAQTSSFAETHAFVCHPFHFWNALHASSPAAALGKVVACLPASQAPTERVFSSADWQCANRERLSFSMLATEVFIRVNYMKLCHA